LAILVVLGSLVFSLQWLSGAHRSEVGAKPDEGAHYITGLMVRDYLMSADHRNPMGFAETYYLHYPRVAIGHWPPVFYLLQASWMLIFGITPSAIRGLVGGCALLLGFLFYRLCSARYGQWAGVGIAALMLATPLLAECSAVIMADVTVALITFAATLFFARYLRTERLRDALWFGIAVLLALLTKSNAMGVLAVPILAIPMSARWRLLGRPGLWIAAVMVVSVWGAWYWLSRQFHGDFFEAPSLTYAIRALGWYSRILLLTAGPLVGLAALTGTAVRVVVPILRGEMVEYLEASLFGLLVGMLVLLCAVPTGLDARHLVPVLPALFVFAAEGVVWASSRLPLLQRRPQTAAGILGLSLALAFLAGTFRIMPRRESGFAAANAQLFAPNSKDKPVVLIATDPMGENMMLGDLVQREERPGHYVLRASKVIADQDWNERDYKLRYQTPAELIAYLDSVPIDHVLIDESPSGLDHHEHIDLVSQTIREVPSRWSELGRYPRISNGQVWSNALRLYEFKHPPSGELRIRADLSRTLRRTLQLRR
jgi:hypothetical protein